jgi:hypothetical protein
MNKSLGVRGHRVSAWRGFCRSGTIPLLSCAALLCLAAVADADQLVVTGANRSGNAVYNLGFTPSTQSPTPTNPLKPLFTGTTTQINSAADAKTHAGFDAMVWVSNPVCQSLDLIVADAANGQIVRYSGATTLPNCNAPTSTSSGTPLVNPASQLLFKWSKIGSGPAQPTGISADASGNLFVVASSGSWDPNASLWVLPFNRTANQYCKSTPAGAYCAPVLVDEKFGGTYTQQLSEVLVAGVAAGNGGKSALWNAGDVLVLVGDSFDARMMDYAQTKLYYSASSGKNAGLLNLAALPLNAPTSTPIPWSLFHAQTATPAGMDIWPANPVWHTNTTLLFTTADGRVLEFDSLLNKVVCNFTENRGAGLQKIKVGSYASVSYAFVSQLEANNTGQILVFVAAPVTGPNNPFRTISTGIANPVGLAVTSAGSASLTAGKQGTTPCAPPNAPCVIAPLGPELTSSITAAPGDNLSGTVSEQSCLVTTDPRVTISNTGVWSCPSAPALPIGAGTSYCPSFPAAIIPGSVCGHSGMTGAGFAVIEGTGLGIDPNDNNSFIVTAGNIDAVLPGAGNLECTSFATTGQIPLIAWGTRSDLTTVEGTIAEDTLGSFATLGGAAGYLTELTGGCDTSTTGSRGISIFAIGLGLSTPPQSENYQPFLYQLLAQKFAALNQTIATAAVNPASVATTLETYIGSVSGAQFFVNESQSTGSVTANMNCALAQIYAADNYLRTPATLADFSSSLNTTSGGGNPNPAGDIDGRLANLFLLIYTEFLGNPPPAPQAPPNFQIPASAVPSCGLMQPPYSVGGTVKGLSGGSQVMLVNQSNGDTQTVTGGGTGTDSFTFPADLNPGAAYSITVATQPPNQMCSSTNASGNIGEGNVSSVLFTCTTNSPSLGISYFTISTGDPDPGNVGSGTCSDYVASALGPDGLPVLNGSWDSACGGIPKDVNPTDSGNEITWWSPLFNTYVTSTGPGTVLLPYSNADFYPPNGTGPCDGNCVEGYGGYQAAILSGHLTAPQGGAIVSFTVSADDMAFVYLDGVYVCGIGGVHGVTAATLPSCTDSAISVGPHSLEVFYVDMATSQAELDFDITATPNIVVTP